jgi:cytochrome c oxidase subunit II
MSLSPRTRTAPGMIVAGVFVVALLLVVAAIVATGTDVSAALRAAVDSMFPPEAVTTEAVQVRDLYNIVFFLAAAIFIAVEALIIWTVIRYRRKDGDDELPPQTHGNNLAEILWTVIPTVIVAFLFFISWQTLNTVEAVSENPGVQVRARAAQFQWTFEYLAADGETVEYSQFVPVGENGGMFVPVGEPVKVYLESPDVIHAFYVPQFLFKRDVVPGKVNVFDFTIDPKFEGSTFRGQCAELCGAGHRAMVFEVHALSRADYDAWLEEATSQAEPSGPPPEGSGAPPPAATVDIVAEGVSFTTDAVQAPADQPFAIHFDNRDPSVPHDVDIRDAGGAVVSDEEPFPGPEARDYQIDPLPAGEYQFFCSVHPNMTGTLTVQ